MVAAESSTAAWLAAGGSVGAAVGTVGAVCVALYLAIRDSRWRRAERDDRDAAQARLVTVAVEHDHSDRRPDPPRTYAQIANDSQLPIFDVHVVDLRFGRTRLREWDLVAPAPVAANTRPRVRPGEPPIVIPIEYQAARRVHPFFRHLLGCSDDATDIVVTIAFTDADGFRWRRQGNALPTRVISPTPR